MYIIRRSFKGHRGLLSAGSVVEPADVKQFKYRLNEKHIVEVNEQNFERYHSFFLERFGIDITPKPELEIEPEQKPELEIEPEQKVVKAKAK